MISPAFCNPSSLYHAGAWSNRQSGHILAILSSPLLSKGCWWLNPEFLAGKTRFRWEQYQLSSSLTFTGSEIDERMLIKLMGWNNLCVCLCYLALDRQGRDGPTPDLKTTKHPRVKYWSSHLALWRAVNLICDPCQFGRRPWAECSKVDLNKLCGD